MTNHVLACVRTYVRTCVREYLRACESVCVFMQCNMCVHVRRYAEKCEKAMYLSIDALFCEHLGSLQAKTNHPRERHKRHIGAWVI